MPVSYTHLDVYKRQPYKYYQFWGFTSQLIIIIPEKNMVIVRTGKFENEEKDKKGRSAQAAFLAENAVKTFAN